jgi:murein DD-endopeptidase MepM/ murein hydrolase activator NlpD
MMWQPLFSTLLLFGAVASILAARAKRKVLRYPVANPNITSPFGDRIHPITKVKTFHNGIDLSGKIGQVIAAPADGEVKTVYTNDAGGLQMTVKHDNGFTTGYAHLSKVQAAVGQRVTQSQVIALMGNSGQSTGPHLHFTVRDESGNLVNPVDYLI